jgi:glycosyltransferase involved in cell wall biosynthesis
MKVAIIHDWLVTYAGAERVLEQMLELWPTADLYSVVDFLGSDERLFLKGCEVKTTFIQRMPFAKKYFRQYLLLMPLAIEQFDFSGYDLIISSSHAVAKGVITGPDQLNISYCHSPMRYAWDLQSQYLKEAKLEYGFKSCIVRIIFFFMRIWDACSSPRVDYFVAVSKFISRRINKVYRCESHVIYPPVDVEQFQINIEKEDFYLTSSRLVPYKRVPLIIESFNKMVDKKLIVIGDGPEAYRCVKLANKNIIILGYQSTEVIISYMQRAKAFVFAAEEDFGISPIEAQACGTPVIAYAKGGVLETIRGQNCPTPTGVFFNEQTTDSIISAVILFETEIQQKITPQACRSNAERFSQQRFRAELNEFIEDKWQEFEKSKRNE